MSVVEGEIAASVAASGQPVGSAGDEPARAPVSAAPSGGAAAAGRGRNKARQTRTVGCEGGDSGVHEQVAPDAQRCSVPAPSARSSSAPSVSASAESVCSTAPEQRPVTRLVQGVRGFLHVVNSPAQGAARLIAGACHHVSGVVAGLSRRLFGRKHSLLRIKVVIAGTPAVALVDSGASHSFVGRGFTQRSHVKPVRMVQASGLSVQFGDGRKAAVHDCLPRVSVKLGDGYKFPHKFMVCDIAEEVILGQDWLQAHNPSIDWAKGTVVLAGPHGRGKDVCLQDVTAVRPEQQPEFVVSHMRLKRLVKKPSVQTYVAWVKQVGLSGNGSVRGGAQIHLQHAQVTHKSGPQPQPAPKIPASGIPEIDALVQEYSDVFQTPVGMPSFRGEEGHRINIVPGSVPPFKPGFRMNAAELAELNKQLQELLDKGWIRPSSSMYGAPVLFVRKPDGTLRMCIDYRALNQQTVRDRYPLPRIDELLDQLGGAAVYSRLDLASGYYQMRMHPDDVHKSAFTCRYGLFEWTVMPMGLTNAPSAFMRHMHRVFGRCLDRFLVVYLDDLLLFSRSVDEHVVHLREVLGKLREHQLFAKPSKCEFGQEEIAFLGHRVSKAGIKMDPTKVKAVVDWPKAQDVSQLRSFMGLANYFRRFVHKFAQIAAPLTDLLNKKVLEEHWGESQDAAFAKLKQALVSAPVLKVADPNRAFVVQSDASDFAVGGVLLQEFAGQLHPIAFYSRKLNSAERNYTVSEREMLGVVECVKSWSHYIGGSGATVHTDHKSLEYFWQQPKMQGRQTRWMECLQQHHVDLLYIKGEDNVVADALSRRPDHMQPAALGVLEVESGVSRLDSQWGEQLRAAASADPDYQRLVQKVDKGGMRNHTLADGLVLHTDRRGQRVVVPANDGVKASIIGELHDVPSAGHLGHHKTYARVAALFEWPRMQQEIHNYCKSCQVCMAAKAGTLKPAGLLQPLSVPERKWQSVGMDFIVRLPMTEAGHDALMVVTDRLTKMVRCVPMTTTVTAPEVAEMFVENVVRLYGVPQEIVSDRDSKFTSAFWQALFRSLGTKLSMSSSYHPQSDGQSERSNQSVEQVLRCYVSAYNNDWDKHLALAEFSLNSAVNVSTGFSPFRLMYGFEPSSPLQLIVDALQQVSGGAGGVRRVEETARMLDRMAGELVHAKENIGRARGQAVVQANKHRRDVGYEVGGEVMLSTANLRLAGTSRKFTARWVGPFKVKKLVGPVAVELDLPHAIKLHPVVHVSQVKPWHVDARWGDRGAPPPPIVNEDGGESYLVESILRHRVMRQGKSRRPALQFLVKWLGYPVWDCTWEPESHFPRDSEALLEYKLKNKL